MHNTLTIAIVAGLGGMLGWGFADFFAKKTIDRIGAIKSLVWAHIFGTSLFLIVTLGAVTIGNRNISLPQSGSVWLGLIFFGVLQMIVYWLAYEGFGKGQLAVLNPVFASYSGMVAVIAIIGGEVLSPLLGLALVLIFGGLLLINIDLDGLRSKKLNIVPGLKEVAAAALLAAFWTLGWDRFISGKDPLSYALLMYVFMSFAALCLARIMKVGLSGVSKGLWTFIALIGMSEMLAYLAVSWGFSETPYTSVVALISGSFSVPTVILAYIFLKERITRLQTLAIVTIIIGVGLVAVS